MLVLGHNEPEPFAEVRGILSQQPVEGTKDSRQIRLKMSIVHKVFKVGLELSCALCFVSLFNGSIFISKLVGGDHRHNLML